MGQNLHKIINTAFDAQEEISLMLREEKTLPEVLISDQH